MAAAYRLAEGGAQVTLVSKDLPQRAGSACIRDGIAAVLDGSSGDSAELHASDTLGCGDGFASEVAVRRMCEAAPAIARLMFRLGLTYDRAQDGSPRKVSTPGSSRPRVMQSGRAMGQRLLGVLAGQTARAQAAGRLNAFYGWEFLSIIQDDDGRARGFVAQDLRNMEIRAFPADAVIVCTGGYASVFSPSLGAGPADGASLIALCEQGARLANPEFVQATPFSVEGVSRAVGVPGCALSMGGVWAERDGRPWRFIEEMYPERRGVVPTYLASRSLVRAAKELGAEAGGFARIDITGIDPDRAWSEMLPFMDACAQAGIDPLSEPVQVRPAVQRTLGGLWVDEGHSTSVPGLYAAGQAACQYHGACALGGNELIASLHGGFTSAASALQWVGATGATEASASMRSHAVEREEDLVARVSAKEGAENAYAIAWELGREMGPDVFLEKSAERLARAAGRIDELAERLGAAALIDRSEWANAELSFHRRLARTIEMARLYASASIAREESRGVHFRAKHPERDDSRWMVTTVALLEKGSFKLDHSERVAATDGLARRSSGEGGGK